MSSEILPCLSRFVNLWEEVPNSSNMVDMTKVTILSRDKVLEYSQTSLQSHLIQHHSLFTTKYVHVRNCFTGLCTKCTGYNSNLVIAVQNSGTNGVVVNRFDCISTYICTWYQVPQRLC